MIYNFEIVAIKRLDSVKVIEIEPCYEQIGLRGFRPEVRHKPGCTATEDGKRLEITDLGSRGIVLSV